ncbi:von Willebrand factor A domain-containing protein 5A-like [Cheilinus undulatus]|uniref:von Willebrand factor A domain-containing protein 5A-like n=1 Tax=Cheilinus undulatus TaxID=241271 RepID=UPI001BD4E29D|nr:von Willebrand factor A domain-containing protein 5A-like [Cheilinus undulatus]
MILIWKPPRMGFKNCFSPAIDTLLLLLKSLPLGCYFNIYSFGSGYEHIFPKSVEYSQKTMEEALKKVGEMEANLGGTEILRPLQHIYSQPCIQNQPRQLFVFTDGEVWNTKVVIDLVKKNSHLHRCFSFGIGERASSALINGLAKEGGGHAQFITSTDRMQPKLMQSLRYALQPAVIDVSVSWDLPKVVSVSVLSPPITALFQGQRSLVYAQLSGQIPEAAEGSVTVKYTLAGQPLQNRFNFSLKPAEDSGLTVHRLAARALIRSLEMENRESKDQSVHDLFYEGASSPLEWWYNSDENMSEPSKPPMDPLLQLVSLQKASGCWDLAPDLAAAVGKTSEEVEKQKPALVSQEVWATILSLIWLHGFKMDSKDEWELLAMKAVSWLQAQNVSCVEECVDAGNALLGCKVQKDALGL